MFQQRHFEALAQLVQDARRDLGADIEALEVMDGVQQRLCDLFARGNPRFDRGRFERACVPGANVRKRVA